VTQLVGLDVGTTGVKALALSPEGDVLARAEESYGLSTPYPGWAEQDPEDWWRAAERALAKLGGEPAAIGLSGQMHGLVVLDDRDRVLRPAILWNDQRTEAECVEIEERVGLSRLINVSLRRTWKPSSSPVCVVP
jgi:xylulokinase